jgi:hypothetical protein
MENIIENTNIKKIIITGTNTKYEMNKLVNGRKKEPKPRVKSTEWDLNQTSLSYFNQIQILENIYNKVFNNKHHELASNHIKMKLSSYKQQDIIKNKYNEKEFITFDDTVKLLYECKLKCHYCSNEMMLLYEFVRQSQQWSLDRIDNDIGHNKNNLVVACLECNLKRRRTNKDSFMFTKNLKIIRKGLDDIKEDDEC